MAKQTQDKFTGFDQKKIAAVERWIDKCDEKREMIGGLQTELANHEFKLAEAIRANEADVAHEEHPKKGPQLVYRRGDYTASCGRGKEKVNYKRKDGAKGEPPEEVAS